MEENKKVKVETDAPGDIKFDSELLPEFLQAAMADLGLEGDVSVQIRDMGVDEVDNPGLDVTDDRAIITLHPNVVVGGFPEIYTLADAVGDMRHALGRLVLAGWFSPGCPGMEKWGPVVRRHRIENVVREDRLVEAIAGV